MAIEVIKCKAGKVFSMCNMPDDIEWRFEKIWYKAQGCTVESVERHPFGNCKCDHCKTINHAGYEFMEELKNSD